MGLCADCARIQTTCCQRADIVVTDGDARRIVAATHRLDFAEHGRPSDPAYYEPRAGDPHWLLYTQRPDGTRRMLRKKHDGNCLFLGEAGCTLPVAARPLVCRLCAFAYTETTLGGAEPDCCPMTLVYARGVGVLEALEMTDRDAFDHLRQQLYAELRGSSLEPGMGPSMDPCMGAGASSSVAARGCA